MPVNMTLKLRTRQAITAWWVRLAHQPCLRITFARMCAVTTVIIVLLTLLAWGPFQYVVIIPLFLLRDINNGALCSHSPCCSTKWDLRKKCGFLSATEVVCVQIHICDPIYTYLV